MLFRRSSTLTDARFDIIMDLLKKDPVLKVKLVRWLYDTMARDLEADKAA